MVQKIIAITTITIFSFFTVPLYSHAEGVAPTQVGAYIGSLPMDIPISNRNGFPTHYGTWAGNLYLYNNKIEIQQWVFNQKQAMIKTALNDAKEFAKKNKSKYFAIDNITFQIVHTENKAELFMDCNVIVWL